MSDFTIDIELDASPAAVFNYLADGSRTPEWYEAVQAATKTTKGPTGEGTRYTFTRVLPQGEVVNDVEVHPGAWLFRVGPDSGRRLRIRPPWFSAGTWTGNDPGDEGVSRTGHLP
jgi:hypothetical protein